MTNEIKTEITTLSAELKNAEMKASADAQILRANPSFYDVKAHNVIVVKEANAIIAQNEKVQVAKLNLEAVQKTFKAVKMAECPTEVRVINSAKKALKSFCQSLIKADISQPIPDFNSYNEQFEALKLGKAKAKKLEMEAKQ
jgi:hypothetical protein